MIPNYSKDENRLFRCRFCGASIVQAGCRGEAPRFCCTNDKCRAVVRFDLPVGASEDEHREHYKAYAEKFPAELPTEESAE